MSKESTTVSVICDAKKLPEEIKTKAHEYAEKRKPQFKIFGIVRDDVEDAWLNGFAFCMEGEVTVKVKQCATCVYTDNPCLPSDYEKGVEGRCDHYKSVYESYSILKKRAREIIETFLGFAEAFGYSPSMDKFISEAEQFLKDCEVEQ